LSISLRQLGVSKPERSLIAVGYTLFSNNISVNIVQVAVCGPDFYLCQCPNL
jgi:hypothetical protein